MWAATDLLESSWDVKTIVLSLLSTYICGYIAYFCVISFYRPKSYHEPVYYSRERVTSVLTADSEDMEKYDENSKKCVDFISMDPLFPHILGMPNCSDELVGTPYITYFPSLRIRF